jgi:hypothetical protein
MEKSEYTDGMSAKKPSSEADRLATRDVVRLQTFTPWWVKCSRCLGLAYMTPRWADGKAECKCGHCGAIYSVPLSLDDGRLYIELPFWFKANFRGEVFWAVNGEHLDHLKRVIHATLRERPVFGQESPKFRKRSITNQNMPFNLPAWLLSAKNRPDLLRLITRLRKTVPS